MPDGALNLAGKLTLGGTGCLLAAPRSTSGPDTAVTHMAAALGVPTVALYGPTDPVKWGPWPRDYAGSGNPWRRLGSQASGSVRLLQGDRRLRAVRPGRLRPARRELQRLPAAATRRAGDRGDRIVLDAGLNTG